MESCLRMLPLGARRLGLAGFVACFWVCASNGLCWQIIGSVKDDVANPIAGVWISAHGSAGETNFASLQVMTEEDGGFRFEAFDGKWLFFVDWSTLNSRGFLGVPQQTVVVEGADEIVEFICPKVLYNMRLSGTVVDDHGGPISNANVSVLALNDYYAAATNSDAAGRFDLPLLGGFWDLSVTADPSGLPQLLMPRICVRTIDGIDRTNFLLVARVPTAQVVASVSPGDLILDSPTAFMAAGPTNYYADGAMSSRNQFTFNLSE